MDSFCRKSMCKILRLLVILIIFYSHLTEGGTYEKLKEIK